MDTDYKLQNLQCQQRAASTFSVQSCSCALSNLTAMVLVSTASRRHRHHERASGRHSCNCSHVQQCSIVIIFRLNGCRVRVTGAVNGSEHLSAHTLTGNTSPGGCNRCGTTLHANSSQFDQVRAMPGLRGRRGAHVLRGAPCRWLRSLLPSKQHRRLRVRLGRRCGGSVAALLVLLRRTSCGVIQLRQVQALHSNSARFCVCVTGHKRAWAEFTVIVSMELRAEKASTARQRRQTEHLNKFMSKNQWPPEAAAVQHQEDWRAWEQLGRFMSGCGDLTPPEQKSLFQDLLRAVLAQPAVGLQSVLHFHLCPLCLCPLCLYPLCLYPLCLYPLCLYPLCLYPLCFLPCFIGYP